jgi:hypothetical protein
LALLTGIDSVVGRDIEEVIVGFGKVNGFQSLRGIGIETCLEIGYNIL